MLDNGKLLMFDGDVGYKTHCKRKVLWLGCAKRYYFVFSMLTFIST